MDSTASIWEDQGFESCSGLVIDLQVVRMAVAPFPFPTHSRQGLAFTEITTRSTFICMPGALTIKNVDGDCHEEVDLVRAVVSAESSLVLSQGPQTCRVQVKAFFYLMQNPCHQAKPGQPTTRQALPVRQELKKLACQLSKANLMVLLVLSNFCFIPGGPMPNTEYPVILPPVALF
eukprot:1140844-Pelagomonas_calceolata.AAC.6